MLDTKEPRSVHTRLKPIESVKKRLDPNTLTKARWAGVITPIDRTRMLAMIMFMTYLHEEKVSQ